MNDMCAKELDEQRRARVESGVEFKLDEELVAGVGKVIYMREVVAFQPRVDATYQRPPPRRRMCRQRSCRDAILRAIPCRRSTRKVSRRYFDALHVVAFYEGGLTRRASRHHVDYGKTVYGQNSARPP